MSLGLQNTQRDGIYVLHGHYIFVAHARQEENCPVSISIRQLVNEYDTNTKRTFWSLVVSSIKAEEAGLPFNSIQFLTPTAVIYPTDVHKEAEARIGPTQCRGLQDRGMHCQGCVPPTYWALSRVSRAGNTFLRVRTPFFTSAFLRSDAAVFSSGVRFLCGVVSHYYHAAFFKIVRAFNVVAEALSFPHHILFTDGILLEDPLNVQVQPARADLHYTGRYIDS
ncbi:hypothetical protein B0H11DRAFT_2252927 [Mycena galericulata]|nr:hypothetical protein B0H11DRAFT_2252927 [Mycena galericulata]